MPENATTTIEDNLCWDVNSPDEEWQLGFSEGTETALREIHDRRELVEILDALDASPVAFLRRIQRATFIHEVEARTAPLDLFEALMFGALSGGLNGTYARAYASAFRAVAPFVRSLH